MKKVGMGLLGSASTALLLLTTLSVQAAGKITIPPAATIDPNSGINAKVKEECLPDAKVTELLKAQLKSAGYEVEVAKQASGGRSLQLTITNVQGIGGGAWTGSKSMSIAGKLYDGGKLVGVCAGHVPPDRSILRHARLALY